MLNYVTIQADKVPVFCYQAAARSCEIKNLDLDQESTRIDRVVIPQIKSAEQFRSATITSVRIECSYQTGNNVKFMPVDLFARFLEHDVKIKELILISCENLEKLIGNEFSDADNLEVLKISKTNLNEIDESSFEKFINVYSLDLSDNQIESLESFLLMNMQKLSSLNLSNNKLQCLPAQLLKHTTILRHLRLENNDLEFIEIPSQISKTLRYLNLEGNKCISRTFHWMHDSYQKFVNKKCFKMPKKCMNMLEVVPLTKDAYYVEK